MTVDPSVTALRVGEEMTVDIEVTNGTAQAETIALTMGVPDVLEFVSSVPSGTSAPAGPPPLSEAVSIPLGSVASGSSASAEVVLAAVKPGPPAGQIEIQADDGAQIVAADNFVVDVLESDAELPGALSLAAAPPSALLAQVGDRVEYELVVANESTEILRDVTIVERVAPEVHVLAAPLVAGVDAVQIGRFLEKEDIVWVIDELDPGEEVGLPWAGQVQAPGDLAVVSNARATARRTDAVSASAEHFLASPSTPTEESNPPFTPIVRRVAITTPAAAPGTLPMTGLAGLWVAVGVIAILVGFTVWRFGSPRARGKRIPGALLLLCLMTAACVSSPSNEEPSASGTPEVKGRRIERGNNNQQNEEQADSDTSQDGDGANDNDNANNNGDASDENGQDGSNDPADDDEPTDVPSDEVATTDEDEVVTPPAPPEEETVSFVTRELTLGELPIEAAASSTGTSGRFEWDESSRSMISASSSIPAGNGPSPIVTTSLPVVSGTIVANVRIQNPFNDRRFHVEGHLVHEISGSGLTTRLLSDPIDVVLAPGGSTLATFEYLAPSGTYDFTGSFVAG